MLEHGRKQCHQKIRCTLISLLTLFWVTASNAELQFESGTTKVQLIELYTSHGCSSCPPADHWLSRFKANKNLWQQYVPVAFHVDYWDYIGWKDRFAKPTYSKRQRMYRVLRKTKSIYTPGFFVDGSEWRGFFAGRPIPLSVESAPVLKVSVSNGKVLVKQLSESGSFLVTNMAILGMGYSDAVTRGENKGRELKSDFVVIEHQKQQKSSRLTLFHLPKQLDTQSASSLAIAVWVADLHGNIIQSTGAWLPESELF